MKELDQLEELEDFVREKWPEYRLAFFIIMGFAFLAACGGC